MLEVTNWQEWEELLLSAQEYTFLQSWQMGELSKSFGNKVLRFKVEFEGNPVLTAQLSVIKARRGKLLQLRHAPTFLPAFFTISTEQQKKVLQEFLAELREIARSEKCDYFRMQPLLKVDDAFTKNFDTIAKNFGFKPANIHNIDAEKTLVLNINPEPEVLLQNMRKQTRYNIRRAEKLGVRIISAKDSEAVKNFYQIHHDTTLRQQFKSYSLDFYLDFVDALNSIPESKLSAEVLLADYEGKRIAGAIIVFFGKKAFYSDGGSLTEYAKIPASYLIQWHAIGTAKNYACESYNFWGGVSPDREDTSYPWYGIDLFKRGFGGERVDYVHAKDLGLSPKYQLTRLFELIEKTRRGY